LGVYRNTGSADTRQGKKMVNLELRLPPPLIFLLCAGAMWWLRGESQPGIWAMTLMAMLVVAGAIMGFGALQRFRHHQTTVSPTKPQHTSRLVTCGVYIWVCSAGWPPGAVISVEVGSGLGQSCWWPG